MSPLLQELIDRQIRRTPTAAAVISGTRTLTYGELDERAEQLAAGLHRAGARRGSLVAVSMTRQADLVATLIAAWRTGSAYVPVDPAYPAERIGLILADTCAAVVVTDETVAGLGLSGRTAGSRAAVTGADAAYVTYTSGSTGVPKGVVVTHEAIANRVRWSVAQHGIGPGDRFLQKTSPGFDAAALEFFVPLVSGGTVVLAPPGAEGDPVAIVSSVIEHEVTVLQAVPSVYTMLTEDPRWGQCRSLRLLFSAGEPLHSRLAARMTGQLNAELWNTYGPTECAVDVTAHQWDPEQDTGPVPIGKPIAGVQVRVLEPHGDLAAVGVPGELYAGGLATARGYLGSPGQTAERFVPDPYGGPGQRLYRTGDRVRWRPDGVLEYLGRFDDQVKINGVRIEPGEIEAALAAHPAVDSAVVAAQRLPDGTSRLVAFVRGAGIPGPRELRSYLAAHLPRAYLPADYLQVDEFPRTANGKTDRAALLQIAADAHAQEGTGAGPSFPALLTPEERLVAGIWRDLLGVDRVAAHDDFFMLGGSSLMLTRLAARLSEASGGQLPLGGLFSATTLAEQAELLGDGSGTVTLTPPAGPVPRDAPLPLSFGQHRLWFLDRMNPGGREWIAPMFLRLPPGTTPDAVQNALDCLQERHEVLRTRYVTRDGEPFQVIVQPGPVELRVADASAGSLEDLFGEQFERGFDLENGPLWRALLARLPDGHLILLVTIHHIASDGWSTVILEREFRELCAGSQLPPLPLQYADFAVWQRRHLTNEALADDLDYWRRTLAGMPQLTLPTDRPRPPVRDARGAGVPVAIPDTVAGQLGVLARQYRATPFVLLLTTFAVLMARHAGTWDIPVGTPVAGRSRPETSPVVGFFLNSLTLRCRLEGGMSFEEAVRRVRTVVADAFTHQDLPFERLVDELGSVRDLSRTPLYQVALDLQDEGQTSTYTADAEAMDAFARAWRVAKTDLTLFLWRRPDGALTGGLEYATALFDEQTVRRLADRYIRLLTAFAADPGLTLNAAVLLEDADRAELTIRCNDTAREWPAASVPAMIEAAVARHGDADAVQCAGRTLSYVQLASAADRLAQSLTAAGVRPGEVVGVLAERSAELIVAMLAVWKAGAAYLPLEPSLPRDRMAVMLGQAKATLTVVPARHHPDVPGRTLVMSLESGPGEGQPRGARWPHPDPEAAAYVIFTSGSTGTPKGVVVTHRGLANHIQWAAAELAAPHAGGAPVFSSVGFDLVMPNLWAPLVTGQRVWLLPGEAGLDELGRQLAAAGPFGFIKLTPGHLEVILEQFAGRGLTGLAGIWVVAGEPFRRGLLDRFRQTVPGAEVLNEYGPTEASVGTCTYPVTEPFGGDVVPIGRPLPNMTMYVLDDAMRLVPAGVAGELYVGGAGVARGYIGSPGSTAARFVPDPFGPSGTRLYRTGDLVRRRADGAVEFIGRTDDQVKIRGYRVEPGEVRAALLAHPDVHDAFVAFRDGRLVAHHVSALTAAELTAHCSGRLPQYMVPDSFVEVEALVLNANGKVDRDALPAPQDVPDDDPLVPPGDPVQEHIAKLWFELLGQDVGVRRDFFRSGGHSILAIQLVARLQEYYGIDVPYRVIFERPTVAGLAEEIEARVRADVEAMETDDSGEPAQ